MHRTFFHVFISLLAVTTCQNNSQKAFAFLQPLPHRTEALKQPRQLPRTVYKPEDSTYQTPQQKPQESLLFASSIPLPRSSATFAILAILTYFFYTQRKLIYAQRHRFYPGSTADPSFTEPLPPGTFEGCPFLGPLELWNGWNPYFSKLSAKLNHPPIFKFFGFSRPIAVFSGSKLIKKVLGKEFNGISQLSSMGNSYIFFGTESMATYSGDKSHYQYLRNLVGNAMTPQAISDAVPALQKAAEEAVNKMLSSGEDKIKMFDVCNRLTVDVAWRQILGLDLEEEEATRFVAEVQHWMKGLLSPIHNMLTLPFFFVKRTRPYKARLYLVSKIEKKIHELEQSGPDGSTLSAMVFATDEDGKAKLTREQVIDNALLLILAGSETSANTLTNAMLLLGMHPHVWDKLVQEQRSLVREHGDTLTKILLDDECPYLEAVIKEVMRLIPVSGGGMRKVDDTFVLNSVQIPKKWLTIYSIGLTHENDPITKKTDGSHNMDLRLGFKPERWLEEETRPTTEYLPFGAGYRYCLGHALAMAEMKLFLAILARKVHFELVSDLESMKWKEGIILTPKDGVEIVAHAV